LTGVADIIEVAAPQDAAGTPGAGLLRDCPACGFRTARLSFGGCCSARCAEFLAAGGPPKSEQARRDDPFRLYPERIGPVGQLRGCDGCGLTFESRGLRLCPDCYLALGDKDDLRRYGPSVAERPVRRATCPICGGDLPMRAAGGKKSRAIFCSGRCQRRHARAKQGGLSAITRPPTIPGRNSAVIATEAAA
jgi:hypothetical protein